MAAAGSPKPTFYLSPAILEEGLRKYVGADSTSPLGVFTWGFIGGFKIQRVPKEML